MILGGFSTFCRVRARMPLERVAMKNAALILALCTSCVAYAQKSDNDTGAHRGGAPAASKVAYLNGTWQGSYKCAQGLTKLTLVITAKSTTEIDAVFLFSPHAQNPGTPSGRFNMQGTLEPSSSSAVPDLLTLKATTWVNQPAGYSTVDLTGDVAPTKNKIEGNVILKGCSTFELLKREL